MPAVFCNEGIAAMNQWMLGDPVTLEVIVLRLFTDTNPLDATDTTTTHTECALAGYVEIVLDPTLWTRTPFTGYMENAYPPATFLFDPYAGGTTIYGWQVVITVDGVDYLWFEDFLLTEYEVPSIGGALVCNLTYIYGGCDQTP